MQCRFRNGTDVIAEIREQDWPDVYGIYKYYVTDSCANFDWEPLDYQTYIQKQKSIAVEYPYLAAFHEGKLIGFGLAHRAFEKASYQYTAELTIYFAPGPHYGLASAMLHVIEEQLKRQNVCWLISCITESNESSVIFHTRHGFSFLGKLPEAGLKNGQWHSVVWYGKELASRKEIAGKSLLFIPKNNLQEKKDDSSSNF